MARFLLAVLLALSTTASALEDVPFVVTPDTVTRAMLDLAKVGRGDFVIDLGSGDGRIVIEAARRYGARGLGVEIVPDLVRTSRESAKRAGVEKQAEFREQDLFQTDLAAATVITLYLLPDVNLQLRPRLLGLKPGTRVVSHDWDMADWKPDKTITLDVPDKPIGFEKKSRVHLWVVPARVEGTWCATGDARGMRIVMRQSFQDVRGEFFDGTASHPFEARIDGDTLRGINTAAARFDLKAERRRLIMQRSGNPLSRPPAVAFVPPARDGCR